MSGVASSKRLDGGAASPDGEWQQALRERGWAIARAAVSAGDVAAARALCDHYLVPGNPDEETEIPATELAQLPELAAILFADEVLRTLRLAIGGTVTYYPNFVMRLNRFTDWHIDNGFLPTYHDEAEHLYDRAFKHLQCVIYLQDNDETTGGGLDVISGSHRWAEEQMEPDHAVLFERFGHGEAVDTRAGDLLMFDGRLLHRGTPALEEAAVRKYGLFFSVSRDERRQVDRFLRYLAGRADHLRSLGLGDEFLEYMLRRYDDVRGVTYPASFLDGTVQTLEEYGLRMATIDEGL